MSDPEPGVLMVSRAVNETGRSPQMGAFVSPIRLALVDEMKAGVVDTRIVTRLSGDGRITWRTRTAALRTDAATATIVCACHTGHVPRLSLHDAAVAARLREIPYPTVRHPDPDFGARMRPPARGRGAVSLAWSRRRSTDPAMTRRRPRLTRSVWRRPAAWTTTRARGASAPAASCRPGGSTRAVSSPSGAPGVRQATTVTATTRTWRAVSTGQRARAECARSSPAPWRHRRRWTVATSAPGTAGRCWTTRPSRGRSSPGPSSGEGGGTGGPSLLVPVFLAADTTTVCDRVTVTTADGTPVVVRTVASRTRVQGSKAEFETAWESFGAPEDVDTDPKPLVVVHASVRRGPADHGPPLWTSALVQDAAHIAGAAGCGWATCWPARPPDHGRCACATWTPEGATRGEAERGTRRRARDDALATRGDPA